MRPLALWDSDSGAVRRGEAKADEVFDLMEKFAGYGFNKSHSTAYALVTYQTAISRRIPRAAILGQKSSCNQTR